MARKKDLAQYWVWVPGIDDDNPGYTWTVYDSQDHALSEIADTVTRRRIDIKDIILIRGVRLDLEAIIPPPAKVTVKVKR
jgi:hypothetical protein